MAQSAVRGAGTVIERSSILVKNVYYMLAYAFQSLRAGEFDDVATEPFDHLHDMFAAILAKGISRQLKQGIHREFRAHTADLPVLRGKIDMPGTVRLRAARRNMLTSEFEDLTENTSLNQILKATARLLIRHGEVSDAHRAALRRVMLFFSDVDDVPPTSIRWGSIRFARNNRSYRMLIGVCQLAVEGMLLTTQRGEYHLMSFLDGQEMSRLYEKFILEYFAARWPV